MFTGIVAEMGRVTQIAATGTEVDGARIVIDAPVTGPGMAIGDSLAVNGTCLTAVALEGSLVTVDAVAETLSRTNLGRLDVDDFVDLERPMPSSGRFDGHIVQGHVDGVGTVVSTVMEGTSRRMRIEMAPDLAGYVVEKGSITVDGVSLTVTAVSDPGFTDDGNAPWFEIAVIPHTLDVTVLGGRKVGDAVNLEVDVIAKYVERLIRHHTATATPGGTRD